jgi:hypothetical protein
MGLEGQRLPPFLSLPQSVGEDSAFFRLRRWPVPLALIPQKRKTRSVAQQ